MARRCSGGVDSVTARRSRMARLASWALALAALAFVAWVVPVRDRCRDPRAPASTGVAVSRDEAGCTLHLRSGAVRIDAAECARLSCEPGVASTFARVRLDVVGVLAIVYALGSLAWSARWRALLAFAGVDLTLLQVWRLSIEAQAGGILLPGGIGGDAFRVASVLARPTRAGKARAPVGVVVGSVLLDRAIGFTVLSGTAAALGFATGGLRAGPVATALALVPVAFVAGLLVLRIAPFERIRWLAEGRAGRLVGAALAYMRDPRAPAAVALGCCLSVVVALSQFIVIRGFVFALGATPTAEKWVYVGTAMSFIATAVPALPSGWGTADAAYVFFLGLAGIGPGIALAVCLLNRLFWYLSGVAGAILHVTRPSAGVTKRASAGPREGSGAGEL